MFINLTKAQNGKAPRYSIRRSPDGVYYAVNDNIVTFDPNPVLSRNLTKEQADKEVLENNKKRGAEFGFDFKGR